MKRRAILKSLGAASGVAFAGIGTASAEAAADADLDPENSDLKYEDPGCSDLGSCQECLDNNCFDCTDYC